MNLETYKHETHARNKIKNKTEISLFAPSLSLSLFYFLIEPSTLNSISLLSFFTTHTLSLSINFNNQSNIYTLMSCRKLSNYYSVFQLTIFAYSNFCNIKINSHSSMFLWLVKSLNAAMQHALFYIY